MTPKQKFIAEYIKKNNKFFKMDEGIAYIMHLDFLNELAKIEWKKHKTKQNGK